MRESAFWIWAHRGASAFAPENTMAAFRMAEEMGADGIELDVHLSADQVPVVIHDTRLERTSNGSGPVNRSSWQQLQQLDMGRWFHPHFSGEPLPSLEQVFEWVGDRMPLNVEIKTAAAASAVLALMDSYPQVQVLLSSFSHKALETLPRGSLHPPLGFLTDSRFWQKPLNRASQAQAFSFHPRQNRVSPSLVTKAHCKGMKVYSYTVDDSQQAQQFRDWGVDGIFTNRLFPQVDRGPGRDKF